MILNLIAYLLLATALTALLLLFLAGIAAGLVKLFTLLPWGAAAVVTVGAAALWCICYAAVRRDL